MELSTLASRTPGPVDEARWAEFVTVAEDAISREHTTWRASHTSEVDAGSSSRAPG